MKPGTLSPSIINNKTLIRVRGDLLDLSLPRVMGILNITPDSFYDGGKYATTAAIVKQAGRMLSHGAAILDLGAASSRPGARAVSAATEARRLKPALKAILDRYPEAIISIDTYRAEIAEACVENGAAIINDISAGELDRKMIPTVAKLGVPYVAMHMKGTPASMQKDPTYKNVVAEVFTYLANKTKQLHKAGISDIILDPGFGFGKSVDDNYRLLNNLPLLSQTGCPLLVGISRKSMICKVLGVNPDKALNGTTALHMAALQQGASIIRAHDVKEAMETILVYETLSKNG